MGRSLKLCCCITDIAELILSEAHVLRELARNFLFNDLQFSCRAAGRKGRARIYAGGSEKMRDALEQPQQSRAELQAVTALGVCALA